MPLCTDRQAQDRSFRQSRPHNPSLKHRNRQGNHWHLRHSTEEGDMVPTQPILTCEAGLEPLGQHITTQQHNSTPDRTESEIAHTTTTCTYAYTHCGPYGSGLTSPGPWLTSRCASKPAAQSLGHAVRTPRGRGCREERVGAKPLTLLLCPHLTSCQRVGSSALLGQGRYNCILLPTLVPHGISGSFLFFLANPPGFQCTAESHSLSLRPCLPPLGPGCGFWLS